jgi:hypothetical protein
MADRGERGSLPRTSQIQGVSKLCLSWQLLWITGGAKLFTEIITACAQLVHRN